jgi:hypothetical protein
MNDDDDDDDVVIVVWPHLGIFPPERPALDDVSTCSLTLGSTTRGINGYNGLREYELELNNVTPQCPDGYSKT